MSDIWIGDILKTKPWLQLIVRYHNLQNIDNNIIIKV